MFHRDIQTPRRNTTCRGVFLTKCAVFWFKCGKVSAFWSVDLLTGCASFESRTPYEKYGSSLERCFNRINFRVDQTSLRNNNTTTTTIKIIITLLVYLICAVNKDNDIKSKRNKTFPSYESWCSNFQTEMSLICKTMIVSRKLLSI